MSSLRIHPLHVGTFIRPKMTFGYWLEPGKEYEFPLIAWYIEGAQKKILVDTGGPDPADDAKRAPYWQSASIAQTLAKIGVPCEAIDVVILTHLHWDHCAGIDQFPNAEILVQEEELQWSRTPLPLHAFGYIKSIVECDRFTVISGEKQIVEGVSVILIPGHTYGSQGVLVEAKTRKYFISGDTFGLFECIERDPPLISGIYVDAREYYASFDKIARLDAFSLPGHDFKVFEKEVYV